MQKLFSIGAVFSILMFAGLMHIIAYILSIHLTARLCIFGILVGLALWLCLGIYDFMLLITEPVKKKER